MYSIRIGFKGTYSEGKLASASITTIVGASFSVKVDDNVFVQDVKTGDVVVDNLNFKQLVTRAKHDADNVLNTKEWREPD